MKPKVFLEENQKAFLQLRDRIRDWFEDNYTFMVQEITRGIPGSEWLYFAFIDRLEELDEIQIIGNYGDAKQFDVYKER